MRKRKIQTDGNFVSCHNLVGWILCVLYKRKGYVINNKLEIWGRKAKQVERMLQTASPFYYSNVICCALRMLALRGGVGLVQSQILLPLRVGRVLPVVRKRPELLKPRA